MSGTQTPQGTSPGTSSGFWKTAFIYGGLPGLLIITWMLGSYTLVGFHSGTGAMITGFLIMFLILSLIFFGMKRFRDKEQGGVMKVSKGIKLGLAMSLFAALAYVSISEIYLAVNDYEFIQAYTDHLIELKKAQSVTGEDLAAFTEKMEQMKTDYANPLYRIALTFFEIFPMGFIVSVVSALFLHTPKFWARG